MTLIDTVSVATIVRNGAVLHPGVLISADLGAAGSLHGLVSHPDL